MSRVVLVSNRVLDLTKAARAGGVAVAIYELLGHARHLPERRIEGVQGQKPLAGVDAAQVPPPREIEPLPSPPRAKAGVAHGSVKSFFRKHVFPADGERVEIKGMMRTTALGAPRRT
jgi:hypothetical protein